MWNSDRIAAKRCLRAQDASTEKSRVSYFQQWNSYLIKVYKDAEEEKIRQTHCFFHSIKMKSMNCTLKIRVVDWNSC